ncbi:hypothetical protein ST47_g8962 [Ascochyta rabiei]|uniref:Uncharacterized protein n=2 Tax=Didymella rabiei TaxID=5454 RepID=A0A162Y8F1_DIDRA|nr:hypothetical protein ST47_g8962 [Ascochyta rabiei]
MLWTKTTQREIFIQHLTNWASHHDSSTYFHGSISLHPQGVITGEVVGLGKSVNCILTSSSSASTSKKVVIRLFQSQQYSGDSRQQTLSGAESWTGREICRRRMMVPYNLIIRSGSGWVTACEFLNKHYFAHLAKMDAQVAKSNAQALKRDAPVAPLSPQRTTRIPLNASNINWDSAFTLSEQDIAARAPLRLLEKDTVTISPLFRPFLRLPLELQDAILYLAVGYTGSISFTHKRCVLGVSVAPKPPITMSTLFLISKAVNEHMAAHVFRSTNFHFGTTGLTKFLWQLGPLNRSRLQHLSLHFGRGSLLHCIRWLAPDLVYELFEPPVVTDPVNLTHFWRCQLRDLMEELNLLTLTIDIKDVPLTDVPMLFRILQTATRSVERIRVIDNQVRSGALSDNFAQGLPSSFRNMPEATWRALSLNYHANHKYRNWYMKPAWQARDVDHRPALDASMDKECAFFDS